MNNSIITIRVFRVFQKKMYIVFFIMSLGIAACSDNGGGGRKPHDSDDSMLPVVTLHPLTVINNYNKKTYSISGSCSEEGRIVSVSIDGGTVTASPVCAGGVFATDSLDVSGIADNDAVSVTADHEDSAGNNADQASATVRKDTIDPTVAVGTPSSLYVNSYGTMEYPVTYTDAAAVDLTSDDITVQGTGGASCATKEVLNGTTAVPLVRLSSCTGNGTIYIQITAGRSIDDAGNTDAGNDASASVTVDNTKPVISDTCPLSSTTVNSTLTSFTFSEICGSGSITWERTGGAIDVNSPHVKPLEGSELNAGPHTNITIINNPTLMESAVYTISFNCSDRAGNTAETVTETGVAFTDSPLQIISAETIDTDNNGKIDTYRIAFNKSVDDFTFPGFSANTAGSVTNEWLVAGYTDVRLLHGTAVTFAIDIPDDPVLYLQFSENLIPCNATDQSGCDTGAKPDLTTTAAHALKDGTGFEIAHVTSANVTEIDGAQPRLITARALNAKEVDVIFSEAIEQGTAETISNYTLYKTGFQQNTVAIFGAIRNADNNKVVRLTTGNMTGGTQYTLTVNTDVKDIANLSLDSSANTALFEGNVLPIVVSIETLNSTHLVMTFNEPVTASSAECSNLTACGLIYSNSALPVLASVSMNGAGVNSTAFKLTVNTMVEGQSYTTTVINDTVTSSTGGGLKMGSTNNSTTFIGDGNPAAVVDLDTVTECPIVSPQRRVVVHYDQPVSENAMNAGNYKISLCLSGDCTSGMEGPNSLGASSVTSLGGNTYTVDFSDPFTPHTSLFQLTITGVTDLKGNLVNSPTNLSFQCGNDNTPPSLIRANVLYSNNLATVVMFTFSESVDQATVNTAAHYKYDGNNYGVNIQSAARQSNTAQVMVVYSPGISKGGHQVRVKNVQDLLGNIIIDNGTHNVQPIIVNAPGSFGDGSVFSDPFNDGTASGFIVQYDGKLYLGADKNASKIFEIDFGMTSSQTIMLDSDGTPGLPLVPFLGNITGVAGATGVDYIYTACVGNGVDTYLTGAACSAASGREYFFIGSRNTVGNYDDLFFSTDASGLTTTFTFNHVDGLESAGNTFRLGQMHMFKGFLYIANGDKGSAGPPYLSRVCMLYPNCANGEPFLNVTQLHGKFITRLGKSSWHDNSKSEKKLQKYANIDVIYEFDSDGPSGSGCNAGTTNCESQLYMANGGWCTGCSTSSPRTGTSESENNVGDGGIVRTTLHYSASDRPPLACMDPEICDADDTYSTTEYYDDITPHSNSKYYQFFSIPPPADPNVEWQVLEPVNTPIPAMWAFPYMKTAPNGDLYAIRNACSTSGFLSGTEFANNSSQVCPKGSEVTQLWMLKSCASSSVCPPGPGDWELVAENGSSGKTNMAGNFVNNGGFIGMNNTHITLLEFVGSYIYIGFDNPIHGANVWRADMSGLSSGLFPSEEDFSIVNMPGLDGTITNQKIFSHITVNEAGTDWLILTTRDGRNAVEIYRTSNEND